MARKVFLLVSQVYPPDPAAVGQHMADVAEALAAREHDVRVLTSNRGYDEPRWRLPTREARNGVSVLRLPATSFGKASFARRLLGGASLVAQASVLGAMLPSLTNVVCTTSPPIGGVVGVVLGRLRRVPFDYWLMDINPDQAVALGRARKEALTTRLFDVLNRRILADARLIVALDHQMASRYTEKGACSASVRVLPPWSPEEHAMPLAHADNGFRRGLASGAERVIMYAGNHSIAHPLDTLVEGIRRTSDCLRLRYVFVGGGLAKTPIDQWIARDQPAAVRSLPYQPRERIREVLSAADVHVIVVGPKTVGVVHPSKTYGALAAGRPVLVIGPKDSPAARIVTEHNVGWWVEHGHVDELQSVLRHIAQMPDGELVGVGQRAHQLAVSAYGRRALVGELCDWLESTP